MSVETEATRREIRRRHILMDAESRLKKILGGPENGAKMSAPVIEGLNNNSKMDSYDGIAYSDFPEHQTCPVTTAKLEPSENGAAVRNRRKGNLAFPAAPLGGVDSPLATHDQSFTCFSPPQAANYKVMWYQRFRVWFSICLGLFTRLVFNISSLSPSLVPQCPLLYFAAAECVFETHAWLVARRLAHAATVRPSHGEMLDFCLSLGFPEWFCLCLGYVVDTCTRVADDGAFMLLSFALSHLLLGAIGLDTTGIYN